MNKGKNMEEKIQKVCVVNHKLYDNENVIFGTGEWAKRAFHFLLHEGIAVKFFSDARKELSGEWMMGREIIHEDELEGTSYNVIICSLYWQDIRKRLEKKKIKNLFVWNNDIESETNIII